MLRGPQIITGRYRGQEGLFEFVGERGTKLVRSFTCQHCNRVIGVPQGADPASIGGLCRLCNGLICPACVSLGYCDPIEAKIERAERAQLRIG